MTQLATGLEGIKQNFLDYQLTEEQFRSKLEQINSTRSKINSELISLTQDYDRKIKQLQSRLDQANSRNDKLAKENSLYRKDIEAFEIRLVQKQKLIASLLNQQSQRATTSQLLNRSTKQDPDSSFTQKMFRKVPQENNILPQNINEDPLNSEGIKASGEENKEQIREDIGRIQLEKKEHTPKVPKPPQRPPPKKRTPPPAPSEKRHLKEENNKQESLPYFSNPPQQQKPQITQQYPQFEQKENESRQAEVQDNEREEMRNQQPVNTYQEEPKDPANFFDNFGANEQQQETQNEREKDSDEKYQNLQYNGEEEYNQQYDTHQTYQQPPNTENFFEQLQNQTDTSKTTAKQQKSPYYMQTPNSEDFFAHLEQGQDNQMEEVQESSIDYTDSNSVMSSAAAKMLESSQGMDHPPMKKMPKKKLKREIKNLDPSAFN